jgi:hypothetical protein
MDVRGRPRDIIAGRWIREALVLAFFIAATLFFTYPRALHLLDGVEHFGGDPLWNIWTLSWDTHQLISDPFHLFEANIFYPYPRTLAWSEHLLANSLLVSPVLLISSSPILAYNLLYVFSFVMSAFGTYLLVTHLTKNRWGGIIAGLIFGFCPYRFAHNGHHLLFTQWMPFIFFYLGRFMETKSRRDLALLTLFFNLQALSSYYYALFLTVLVGFFIILYLILQRDRWSRPLFLGLILFVLVTSAINLPLAKPYFDTSRELGLERALDEVKGYGATLADYRTAPGSNRLYGDIARSRAATDPYLNLAEHSLFPGFIAIGLAILGTVTTLAPSRLFRPSTSGGRDLARTICLMYLLLTVVSFILSLGTGEQFGDGQISVYFPYRWLYDYVPGFHGLRVPARFGIMVVLALSVLAGYGVSNLYRWIEGWSSAAKQNPKMRGAIKASVWLIAVSLVAIEYISIPTAVESAPHDQKIPEIYRWLASQQDDIVVVELPLYTLTREHWVEARRMYYSTYHWKNLVNGYAAFYPDSYLQIAQELQDFPSVRSLELLQGLGVDYVILHRTEFPEDQWKGLEEEIASLSQYLQEVHHSGDDHVYRLTSPLGETGRPTLLTSYEIPCQVPKGSPILLYMRLYNRGRNGYVRDSLTPYHVRYQWLRDGKEIASGETSLEPPLIITPGQLIDVPFVVETPDSYGPASISLSSDWKILEPYSTPAGWVSVIEDQELLAKDLGPQSRGRIPSPLEIAHPMKVDLGEEISLLGYALSEEEAIGRNGLCPGPILHLSLYWQALEELEKDYFVRVALYNEDYHLLWQIDDQPHSKGLPTTQWAKGETVQDEFYIPFDLPMGVYRLVAEMYEEIDGQARSLPTLDRQSGLKSTRVELPQVLVRPNEFIDLAAIGHPLEFSLAGEVALLGYDLDANTVAPGERLHLTLYWEAKRAIDEDYTVFTHLLDESSKIWAQQDNQPLEGWYPTSVWEEGEIVRDEYELLIYDDAPPGRYQLEVGMYLLSTMERLAILNGEGQVQGDRVLLGKVVVTEP